jgi:PhzF family phenazine biosynthesis protein
MEVDVFGTEPYSGNPLAVVLDGDGLSDAEMQRFANWTNFSETTYLLPATDPDADYRVRIFTPSVELPFAGHPTLGSCHAWLAAGGAAQRDDYVVQQCAVGLVNVARSADGALAFAAPPLLRDGPLDDATLDEVVAVLGVSRTDVVDAAWVDNGPGWLCVLLRSANDVLALSPSDSHLKIGVVGPYSQPSPAAYEVRAFFPEQGRLSEDPVTGSLNASVAQWMMSTGRCSAPYVASQGAALGRRGKVTIAEDAARQLWVGGRVTVCVEGHVEL